MVYLAFRSYPPNWEDQWSNVKHWDIEVSFYHLLALNRRFKKLLDILERLRKSPKMFLLQEILRYTITLTESVSSCSYFTASGDFFYRVTCIIFLNGELYRRNPTLFIKLINDSEKHKRNASLKSVSVYRDIDFIRFESPDFFVNLFRLETFFSAKTLWEYECPHKLSFDK